MMCYSLNKDYTVYNLSRVLVQYTNLVYLNKRLIKRLDKCLGVFSVDKGLTNKLANIIINGK